MSRTVTVHVLFITLYTLEVILGSGAYALTTRFQSVKVTTLTSRQSLFTSLSRKIDNPVYIYVFPYYKEKVYLTFAYTPSHVSGNDVHSSSHRDVVSIRVESRDPRSGTYIVALKEKCEFVELIERYNVVILVPYSISRGKRTLCMYGEMDNINKCIDNLKAYYGAKNVVTEKTSLAHCVEQQVKSIVHAYILSHLTEREREFLLKAYMSGYISWRRRAGLSELAESLNVTRPTASLMVRKALEKIVKKLIEVS